MEGLTEDMDFTKHLEDEDDEIAFELTIIETKKGNLFVMLPEDLETPESIEKVGVMLCQLIMNWTLRLKDIMTLMQNALAKKESRIIPVSVMPKDLKL